MLLSKILTENPIAGSWTWYTVENHLLFSESLCNAAGILKGGCYDFNTLIEIIHGNDLLQFINAIEEILHGAPSRWSCFRITTPGGELKRLYCYMEPLTSDDRDIFDITGVCFYESERE